MVEQVGSSHFALHIGGVRVLGLDGSRCLSFVLPPWYGAGPGLPRLAVRVTFEVFVQLRVFMKEGGRPCDP